MRPSEYVRKGWTQRAFARLADGRACPSFAPDAARWCAVGAQAAAEGRGEITEKQSVALQEWIETRIRGDETGWNDAPERTQAEVVALLEEAEAAVLGPAPTGGK